MAKKSSKNYESSAGPIWAPYVGKEVVVQFQGSHVIGVFNTPNFDSRHVSIMPSIVYEADDKRAYVERDVPTNVSLGLLEDVNTVIRPLKNGYLEKKVKELNKAEDKRSGVLGFSHDRD